MISRCQRCQRDILVIRSKNILTDLLHLASRRIRIVLGIIFPQTVQQDLNRRHYRTCIQTFHVIINIIHRFLCLCSQFRLLLLYITIKNPCNPPYILFHVKTGPAPIVTVSEIAGLENQFSGFIFLTRIQEMIQFLLDPV